MQVTDAMVAKALEAYLEADISLEMASDAMRAALTAALAEMWRPIETAPKDGGFILVNDTRYPSRDTFIARWNDCKNHIRANGYWEFADERAHGVGLSRANQPTAWQPLPEPPRSE